MEGFLAECNQLCFLLWEVEISSRASTCKISWPAYLTWGTKSAMWWHSIQCLSNSVFVFSRVGEVLGHDVTVIWWGEAGSSVKCRCLLFLKPCPCCSLAALVLSDWLWLLQFLVMYYSTTFVSNINIYYAFCLFFFVIVFMFRTDKCSCRHCRKVPRVEGCCFIFQKVWYNVNVWHTDKIKLSIQKTTDIFFFFPRCH